MVLDMDFLRIAFVGTPGAGKTAVIERLRRSAKKSASCVEFIGEAATELMADPRNVVLRREHPVEFQKAVSLMQFSREDNGLINAAAIGAVKYIQITDRALPDMYVYLSDEQLSASSFCFPSVDQLYGRYDAILFFDIYEGDGDMRAGNVLRVETDRAELRRLHERSLKVYGGHPVFIRVPCFEKIEDKVAAVADKLNEIAGEKIFGDLVR